jgi:hypothetical protein
MKTKLLFLWVLCLNVYGETLPPDAEALRAKRDAKIAEINQIYATALEKLMKKAMVEGNLETAKLLEEEMNKAAPDPFKVKDPLLSLIGKWKRVGGGNKHDGDIFEFTDERSGQYNGRLPFKFSYNSKTRTITFDSHNWTDKITFTDKPDTLNGVTDTGWSYQLVRMR